MPIKILQNISKKCDIKLEDVEKYWEEAKKQALDQGLKENTPNFYKYVVGILKKRVGEDCVDKLGWAKFESDHETLFDQQFDVFESWINLRSRIGTGIRSRIPNVRRSQAAKRAWKMNRSHYEKSISHWHKSSQGRQFHRMLGRFNKNKRSRINDSYNAEQLAPILMESLCKYMSELINSGLLEAYNYPEVYDICELIGYIGQDYNIIYEIIEEGEDNDGSF